MTLNKQDTIEILLMQPKEIPHELLLIISNFFQKREKIKKGYFAILQFPNTIEQPDFLIAIDASSEVSNEVNLLKNYLFEISFDTKMKKIAIVNVEQNYFLNYFSKIKPFYERNNAI